MNNPFDYIPDKESVDAIRQLFKHIESLKESDNPRDINFCHEMEEGKMVGVLIAEDSSGLRYELYAFSGQIGEGGFNYPGFVGPVFDYLRPDGHFKTREAEISLQNIEIKKFKEGSLARIRRDYEQEKERINTAISIYKERARLSKMERQARRETGMPDESELAAMIRRSQFEKAELHRITKRLKDDLTTFESGLREMESKLDSMKRMRHTDSEALQKWLFDNSRLLNACGESRSLTEIFAETFMKIPPSGAGECCAPKLLQSAYLRGLRPLSIAEFWYGKPKNGEVRIHGNHYPACRGKCLPILNWMLQGLGIELPLNNDNYPLITQDPEIIFENRWFCVVNKPTGMLSVPGKGSALSLQERLIEKYGHDSLVRPAHRLDMDTSGLLIATFGQKSFKAMQSLFARRQVKKIYIADLEGDYQLKGIPRSGQIILPLSPDFLDRPRQLVDFNQGKEALTDYEFTMVTEGCSRVIFQPHTGRTHQLRIHAASPEGLGMPIVGDRLYGKSSCLETDRLHLHAQRLEFTFPLDGKHYSFETPIPF